jgi:hypothetical protein
MEASTTLPFAAWEAFYVIVGSSAAALTGLQFVVIALVAESQARTSHPTIAAFGTPTVVHFCAVLLIAAILSTPWGSLAGAGIGLGACGAAGVSYGALVFRRARRQDTYQPVFEDWLWHTILPAIGYATLVATAVLLAQHPRPALLGVGAAALLLLFVGIHNAWDTVTYIALNHLGERARPEERE